LWQLKLQHFLVVLIIIFNVAVDLPMLIYTTLVSFGILIRLSLDAFCNALARND
jgi:hypothetical protein